jgi:hypothetical protein
VAGRGPAPKPAHLRQRTNRKAGATVIEAAVGGAIPELMHPGGEAWHPGTIAAWREFFESPMASQWLPTDITGLVMLAVCYDRFYKTGDIEFLKEIRLQRPHYGLTPLDRSRLQWEVTRGEEAEQKRAKPAQATGAKPGEDLRKLMKIVNG